MKKLIVEQTSNSPKVILDAENNRFEISGESRPPDAGEFYGEIIRWFEDYKAQDISNPAVVNLNFEYFNTPSARYILDLCKEIGIIRSKGRKMEIRWYYDESDSEMHDAGHQMSRISGLPFEFVKRE